MSISLALFADEITSALNKKCTIGVFIDLKKAFDTIYHDLLLAKLSHYGINGIANDWLTSYLQNRLRYVTFDNCDSDLLNVISRVPHNVIF